MNVHYTRLLGYSLDYCPGAPWSRRWAVVRHAQVGVDQRWGVAIVEAIPVATSPWRWLLGMEWRRALAELPLRTSEIAA
jgi:hypothetical protein